MDELPKAPCSIAVTQPLATAVKDTLSLRLSLQCFLPEILATLAKYFQGLSMVVICGDGEVLCGDGKHNGI